MGHFGALDVEDRVKATPDIFRGLLYQIMMEPGTSPGSIDAIIAELKDGIVILERWKTRCETPSVEDRRDVLDPSLY